MFTMLTCFGTFGTSTSTFSTFYLALFAFGTGFLSTNSKERRSYLALSVTSATKRKIKNNIFPPIFAQKMIFSGNSSNLLYLRTMSAGGYSLRIQGVVIGKQVAYRFSCPLYNMINGCLVGIFISGSGHMPIRCYCLLRMVSPVRSTLYRL